MELLETMKPLMEALSMREIVTYESLLNVLRRDSVIGIG